MTLKHNLFDALDIYFDKKSIPEIEEGVVVTIQGLSARVKLLGSSNIQIARVSRDSKIVPGDQVILIRPKKRQQWTVITATNSNSRGSSEVDLPDVAFELSPPKNIHSLEVLPGCILLIWDAPIQQVVTFEVQQNTSAAEVGASIVLTTRGSYAIIPSEVPLYFRIRCVSDNYQSSTWSSWLLAPPFSFDDFAPAGVDTIVTFYGEVVTFNGEVVTFSE